MSVEEPEKAQERYDRVLSSTIQGLGAYIGNHSMCCSHHSLIAIDGCWVSTEVTAPAVNNELLPQYNDVFGAPLWQMFASKRPLLRRAMAALCKVIVTRFPGMLPLFSYFTACMHVVAYYEWIVGS